MFASEEHPITPPNDSFNERPEGLSSHREASYFFILYGLGLLLLGIITAAMFQSGWLLLILGGFGVVVLIGGAKANSDARDDQASGATELRGRVTGTRHWEGELHEQGVDHFYSMTVAGHEFHVSEDLYTWAQQGDEVVVTYYPRTKSVVEVTRTKKGTQPSLLQEPAIQANLARHEYPIREICRAFQRIGVDARPSVGGLIEIADGPIRQVRAGPMYEFYEISCTVPDPRISPPMFGEIRSVRVTSFPVFGRVKEVQWTVLIGTERDAAVADSLSQNEAVTEALRTYAGDIWVSFDVEGRDVEDRGWTLSPDSVYGDGIWDQQLGQWLSGLRKTWACYQTIAEALLEMPKVGLDV